jgi:endogenous inhibitor of DNA gyrase (YacG/DUF329 family)
MYKEQKYDGVITGYIREKDNACIPVCEDNSDFIELQKWVNEGNTVAPADPEPVPTYADKRRAEYASVGDQLDMIYWDKINGTDNWETSINDVKTRFPKPE